MGVVCTAGRPLTCAVLPTSGQGCWSASFHHLKQMHKIHTNIDSHAHSHRVTWYPWPTTPISQTHRYPAHHPSLYAALSKQMRSWFKLPHDASSPSAASIPFLKSRTSVQRLCLCISGCIPSPNIYHSYSWPPVTVEICLYESFVNQHHFCSTEAKHLGDCLTLNDCLVLAYYCWLTVIFTWREK